MPASETDGAPAPDSQPASHKSVTKRRNPPRESTVPKIQPQLTYTPEQLAALNAPISSAEMAAVWAVIMGTHYVFEGALSGCSILAKYTNVPRSDLVKTVLDSKRKYDEEQLAALTHAIKKQKKQKSEAQHNPREMSLYNLVHLYVHKVVLQQNTNHPAVKASIEKHGSGKVMQIAGELWSQVSKEEKTAWTVLLKEVLQECNKLRHGRSPHGPQPDLLAPYYLHIQNHPEHSLDYFLNLKALPSGASPAAAAAAGQKDGATNSPPSSMEEDGKEDRMSTGGTENGATTGTVNGATTAEEESSDEKSSSDEESSEESSGDDSGDSSNGESEEGMNGHAANGKGVQGQANGNDSGTEGEGMNGGSESEDSEGGEEKGSGGSSSSEDPSSSGSDTESSESIESSSDSDGSDD